MGLDVYKDSISVVVAEPERTPGRLVGKVVHDVCKLLKLFSKIGAAKHLNRLGVIQFGALRRVCFDRCASRDEITT